MKNEIKEVAQVLNLRARLLVIKIIESNRVKSVDNVSFLDKMLWIKQSYTISFHFTYRPGYFKKL